MPKKANKQKHNMLFVLSAFCFLLVSALVTLYISGAFVTIGPGSKTAYQNVTFTDATMRCQEEARDEFTSKLLHLVVDNHSSRFESQHFLYKIFMRAKVKAGGDKHVSLYINCYVKSTNGRLDTFEVFEEVEATKGKVITREPDTLFSWPR